MPGHAEQHQQVRGPVCSTNNHIINAKNHSSIQMNIAKVDKVTGRFNGQFKTYATCAGSFARWINQTILFSDWLKLMELSQRTLDQGKLRNICHK